MSICLEALYVDNDRLALNRGQSKFYTSLIQTSDEKKLKQQEICGPVRVESYLEPAQSDTSTSEILDKANFNYIGNKLQPNDIDDQDDDTETTKDDVERTPTTIIITVIISSVIAFVAMLSILANIYIRSKRSRETTTIRQQVVNQRKPPTSRVASLKMNSRQEFEISLNMSTSQQNSPVSSSEICSLSSTTHSFNPFAAGFVHAKITRPQLQLPTRTTAQKPTQTSDECLLNCLQLNSRTAYNSDYFEYDAFKMGELTPHAEFIFKKVNLNKTADKVTCSTASNESLPPSAPPVTSVPSSSNIVSSFSFDRHDFDRVRYMLNWEPSYGQYEDVFDEFQRYMGNRRHVCTRCEHKDVDDPADSPINLTANAAPNYSDRLTNTNSSAQSTQLTSTSSNFYDDFRDRHTFV